MDACGGFGNFWFVEQTKEVDKLGHSLKIPHLAICSTVTQTQTKNSWAFKK
jgi:hypothetical protein